MSSWTAASSDCSRPMNNYVHVKTADLYRPNARLTPERQGYQVLTPFGKLGYSRFSLRPGRLVVGLVEIGSIVQPVQLLATVVIRLGGQVVRCIPEQVHVGALPDRFGQQLLPRALEVGGRALESTIEFELDRLHHRATPSPGRRRGPRRRPGGHCTPAPPPIQASPICDATTSGSTRQRRTEYRHTTVQEPAVKDVAAFFAK